MLTLNELVTRIIALREEEDTTLTLLAVCPNSAAVLEAAVKVAARSYAPMLFAATLNQVDRDGGYTGWTPVEFVRQMHAYRERYHCHRWLYPCLDHGGPWLKDKHTQERLSLHDAFVEVKQSLTACIEAGYRLLHIDATVDRSMPADLPVPIASVVERTIDLIEHCESERRRLGSPPVSYEVGTEEVHGGLVDLDSFQTFVKDLHSQLDARHLQEARPCFVVGKVGTDLHTTYFDPATADTLYSIVRPLDSLVKGHYTDWVSNPEDYPRSGIGGANVGPEFTGAEYLALTDLAVRELDMRRSRPDQPASGILLALESAVLASSRWQKWLQPDEVGKDFRDLSPERREWLVQTCARYIWTDESVLAARQNLYDNLSLVMADPHQFVVERIACSIEHYVSRFNLFDSLTLLTG